MVFTPKLLFLSSQRGASVNNRRGNYLCRGGGSVGPGKKPRCSQKYDTFMETGNVSEFLHPILLKTWCDWGVIFFFFTIYTWPFIRCDTLISALVQLFFMCGNFGIHRCLGACVLVLSVRQIPVTTIHFITVYVFFMIQFTLIFVV